jgi:RNA polymerase sigma factor (sigma-70 family)
LPDEAKHAIYRSYCEGLSLRVLARRYRRPATTVLRVVNQMRARKLLARPVEYIYHAPFDKPSMRDEILGPMPDLQAFEAKGAKLRASTPKGLSPELTPLYEVQLLTRAQEAHLFRQMNFLKHQAARLLAEMDSARPRLADLDEVEHLLRRAQEVKDLLIRANMRLVVHITKKYTRASEQFLERLSDGNLSLLRAVEKFDFSLGNKFSTYASWAIMNNFFSSVPRGKQGQDRFLTGYEEVFEFAADNRCNEAEALASAAQARSHVHRLLNGLEDRERHVIQLRTGMNEARRLTLAEVGEELGISKERVRQIEGRAMRKLRALAVQERIEI